MAQAALVLDPHTAGPRLAPTAAFDGTDAELVQACIDRTAGAWDLLVARHRDIVRATIARTLRSHTDYADADAIDDIEASLFLSLMNDDARRLRGFRGQASLRGWLRVLAAHRTIDVLRGQRHLVRLDAPTLDGDETRLDAMPDASPGAEDRLQRAQLRQRLALLCSQLNADEQQFVELFYHQELDFTAISAITGSTPAALYTRKNRIRKRLQELARKDGWFDPESRGAV
jgi:RNA polymerase sigma factor (sigma-70 family)